MFKNAGEQIKKCAVSSFYIAVILYVIIAIYVWINVSVLAGVIVLVLGPAAAWFSSLILYGLGELIVNSKKQPEVSTIEKETVYEDELPEL